MGQAREPSQELLTKLLYLPFGKARAFRQAARQADLVDDGRPQHALHLVDPPTAGLWSMPATTTCVSLCPARRSQPQPQTQPVAPSTNMSSRGREFSLPVPFPQQPVGLGSSEIQLESLLISSLGTGLGT